MISNWIRGSRTREFGLGSDSLYNSSVPPQQDICMLSATSRVPMTAAGALRLPWCASVRTLVRPDGHGAQIGSPLTQLCTDHCLQYKI